jgi:thiol-disulfide isomerase/thioredoxin
MSDKSKRTARSAGVSQRRGGNRVVVILVGVAVLAFVGVVAFLSSNEVLGIPTVAEFAGPVSVEGSSLPALPAEGADPLIGQGVRAPVSTALDLSGQEVVIGAPGQAQLVVFLAHWCPACDQEVPAIASIIASGEVPSDVEIVAVLTGYGSERPNWPPDVWLADRGYRGVVARDDVASTLLRTYGIGSFPGFAAIDAEGVVQARTSGLLPTDAILALLDLASAESR